MPAAAPERSEARRSWARRGACVRRTAPRRGESGAAAAGVSRVEAPQHRVVGRLVRRSDRVGQFEGTRRPRRIQPTQDKDGALSLHPETLPRRSGESPLSLTLFFFSSLFFPLACRSFAPFSRAFAPFEFISRLFGTRTRAHRRAYRSKFEIRRAGAYSGRIHQPWMLFANGRPRSRIDRLRRNSLVPRKDERVASRIRPRERPELISFTILPKRARRFFSKRYGTYVSRIVRVYVYTYTCVCMCVACVCVPSVACRVW